jgi:hypothetical protein
MLNWSSRILSTAIMWVRSMQHRVCHKSVASLFSVVVWGHALSHPLGMAISFDIFWPIPITSSFQKAMFCVENNCEDLIVRFLPPRNPNKEQYVHVITSESPVYIYIYCNICARAVHNILLYIYTAKHHKTYHCISLHTLNINSDCCTWRPSSSPTPTWGQTPQTHQIQISRFPLQMQVCVATATVTLEFSSELAHDGSWLGRMLVKQACPKAGFISP